jgi:hypothetical protein
VLLFPPQIPHRLTPRSNPGLRGERPATNSLSHGTAVSQTLWRLVTCLQTLYWQKTDLLQFAKCAKTRLCSTYGQDVLFRVFCVWGTCL